MRTALEALVLFGSIAIFLIGANRRPDAEAETAAREAGWVITSIREQPYEGCDRRGEQIGYLVTGVGPSGATQGHVCCVDGFGSCSVWEGR